MAGDLPLSGLTVLSFESRRAPEMAELIRRFGGEPISAPAMREVPLETSFEAEELLRRLAARSIDIVVLLTGVGTRALVAALEPHCAKERFAALLGNTTIVARGPKPVAALRELGLSPTLLVAEPNTWRDLLATLDQHAPLTGKRIAIQEYGRSNPELLDGLRERGAEVLRVPVYRWEYPVDRGPLQDGIAQLAAGAVDFVLFTSARQVVHVAETAAQLGLADALHHAARTVFASIGPICSEAMQAHDLPVDLEPEHPRMGHLINALAQRGRALLDTKRRNDRC
jgi:uroporphyrinogen-III synthase